MPPLRGWSVVVRFVSSPNNQGIPTYGADSIVSHLSKIAKGGAASVFALQGSAGHRVRASAVPSGLGSYLGNVPPFAKSAKDGPPHREKR